MGGRTIGRFPLMAIAMLSLFAALWGGLLRLGWRPLALEPALAQAHGPLMVCGFLGTLICLERAVALGSWWAYVAPLLTGLGALTLIVGMPGQAGRVLITLGSLGLVLNFAIIIRAPDRVVYRDDGTGRVGLAGGKLLMARGRAHQQPGLLLGGIPGAHYLGRAARAEPYARPRSEATRRS